MAENNLDAAILKKTQDILGKFIKKPALTEKLLNKPPFRFIHDIVNSIIKETGFLHGLFTKAELNSDNIKDRDTKVKFLQKLIDAMKLISNSHIMARPSKIVAGQEADRTNELLQLIGMAIENKLDYKQAVELVQAQNASGKKRSNSKEKFKSNLSNVESQNKATSRKENHKNDIKTKPSKAAPVKNSNANRTASKTSLKALSKATENMELKKLNEKSLRKESNINIESIKTERTAPKLIDFVHKSSEYQKNELNNEITNETAPKLDDFVCKSSKYQENELNNEIATENSKEPTRFKDSVEINEDPDEKEKRNSVVEKNKIRLEETSSTTNELTKTDGQIMKEELNTMKPAESISCEVFEDKSIPNIAEVKRQSTFIREDSQHEIAAYRPRTSLRPPSERPASARPGAPRRRDKNVEIILQPNKELKLSGIKLKLENFESQLDDDGETLVIVESSRAEKPSKHKNIVQMETEIRQGHLVQQILQTQKELIQTELKDGTEYSEDFVATTLDKKQSSTRQMDSLRDVIQSLTRLTNPLGKLLDFLPEDVDSMQLELNMWRDCYSLSRNELKKEKSLTESALEPLKNQLDEIYISIKEHKDMINRTRAKILRNADQINKSLTDQ